MNRSILISDKEHPISLIRTIERRFGDDLLLGFSKYYYRPQTVLDQRFAFEVEISSVTEIWLDDQLHSLSDGWELAIHSVVKDYRSRTKHLGMIDFAEAANPFDYSDLLSNILGRKFVNNLAIFDSGRSFHGYGLVLMEPKEWIQFMGKLLLLNMPNGEEIVDSRWIGHRLIAGYSALRWSVNTKWYKKMPTRIDRLLK